MPPEPDWYNVSLKVFLKNKEGKILALKCPAGSEMADFYDIPGGRIDPDEYTVPYEDIIKRELAEEISPDVKYKLNLKPVSFARHRYFSQRQNKEVRILFLYFAAEYLGGEVRVSHEHTVAAWLDINNIKIEDYFVLGCLEGVKRFLVL